MSEQPFDGSAVIQHERTLQAQYEAAGLGDAPAMYAIWHQELEDRLPAVRTVSGWLLTGHQITQDMVDEQICACLASVGFQAPSGTIPELY